MAERIAFAVLYLLCKRWRSQGRPLWLQKTIQKYIQLGELNILLQVLSLDNCRLQDYQKLTSGQFDNLLPQVWCQDLSQVSFIPNTESDLLSLHCIM